MSTLKIRAWLRALNWHEGQTWYVVVNIMPRASRVIKAKCNTPIEFSGEGKLPEDLIGALSSTSGLAMLI